MNIRILIRTCLRLNWQHPLRTCLLIFGIALGVAGVISIDIAKTSVSKSFDLSVAALTQRSTHQITGSSFTIPQSLFTDIRTQFGIMASAPVITSRVRVEQWGSSPLTLMGVDPFSEAVFRNLTLIPTGRGDSSDIPGLLSHSNGVFVSKAQANDHDLSLNDTITLVFGNRRIPVSISGFLGSQDNQMDLAMKGLILTDISLAQEILNLGDKISRIDLILTDETQEKMIQSHLPKGIVLVKTDDQHHVMRKLSQSFETSLTAFSMLALFMGIFLIYNTVSFSITRQNRINGTLRAIGATRGNLFLTIMGEVTTYALAGSLLGAGLGVLLGKIAVLVVCSTVSDMYFVLTVSKVHFTRHTILKGVSAGILATFAASLFPALNAAKTLPITLMQRSAAETTLEKYMGWFTLAGIKYWIQTDFRSQPKKSGKARRQVYPTRLNGASPCRTKIWYWMWCRSFPTRNISIHLPTGKGRLLLRAAVKMTLSKDLDMWNSPGIKAVLLTLLWHIFLVRFCRPVRIPKQA